MRPTREAVQAARDTIWGRTGMAGQAGVDANRAAAVVIGEWNRHSCHVRGCDEPATTVYYRRQTNAHRGESTFRYQRCERHPLSRADYAFVYDENLQTNEEHQKGVRVLGERPHDSKEADGV